MFCAMGEDAALHIGAADLTWGDLRWFAICSAAVAGIGLFMWGRWHLRSWRIRRAIDRGDHDQAALLSLDHEEDEPPRPLRDILKGFAIVLIGTPAMVIVQANLIDELEHMMGPGWGFAAMALTLGFIFACGGMWDRVKRNAMSPEELAALEEEEEHQRWMRSIGGGDSLPAPVVAIAIGLVFLGAVYFLFSAITPG